MSSSNVDDVMLTLVSQEGDTFRVPLKVCMQSEMLKGMIDTTDGEYFVLACYTLQCSNLFFVFSTASAADEDIPITDVKSAVLAKVIEFMEHHTESKLPEIEKVCTYLQNLLESFFANSSLFLLHSLSALPTWLNLCLNGMQTLLIIVKWKCSLS